MQTSMDVKLIISEVDRYHERQPVEEVCWRSRTCTSPLLNPQHELAL